MQVVSIHEDVLVVRSAFWQTTCSIVHHGEETFVIDSPPLALTPRYMPSAMVASLPNSG